MNGITCTQTPTPQYPQSPASRLVGGKYPDLGSAVETFTDGRMLELETLSPIARVEPGGVIEQFTENWYLWRDVAAPLGDDDVDRHIFPKLARLQPGAARSALP